MGPRIRPPDPLIEGPALAYMPMGSAEAIRHILHLAFRDAHTALDLTYGSGGFWMIEKPPRLTVVSNNPDEGADADLHRDFTDTHLSEGTFDVVLLDPPHLADGGSGGIMATRYGTVKGTDALRRLIVDGALEAWRLARVGIVVKVADHSHGGEFLPLSDWVKAVLPVPPYFVLHTYRTRPMVDGKWKVQRAPRSNGATYLVFRKEGHRHRDFDRLYAAQQKGGPLPGQISLDAALDAETPPEAVRTQGGVQAKEGSPSGAL